MTAINANNASIGGGYIDHGSEALVVRGAGLLKSLEEIGNIVVAGNREGVPIFVKNIANVSWARQPHNGTRWLSMSMTTWLKVSSCLSRARMPTKY